MISLSPSLHTDINVYIYIYILPIDCPLIAYAHDMGQGLNGLGLVPGPQSPRPWSCPCVPCRPWHGLDPCNGYRQDMLCNIPGYIHM